MLRRLSDGKLHSGEALAAGSGISRARVSQLLKQADAAGLSLERTPGRGYRLHDALPFLESGTIVAAIGGSAQPVTIEVADCLDSTNSELARRAGHADIHRHLLAAEWQTAGRGRRGRGWTAVLGGSLTFSVGWRFLQGAGHLSALPLAVGVALARALESEGYSGVELKWPNDLIHGEAKVGGILVELSGDALGPSLAIVGVGLNIRLPASLRRGIGRPITDLATIGGGKPIDRNTLLARIIGELVPVLEEYAGVGIRSIARRVATPPRVPGKAGAGPAPGQRDGARRSRRR